VSKATEQLHSGFHEYGRKRLNPKVLKCIENECINILLRDIACAAVFDLVKLVCGLIQGNENVGFENSICI